MNYSPARLILIFFLSVLTFGAFALSLPVCRNQEFTFSFLSNLFTATSAVCVTGLSVVDIGKYYSFTGQLVILFLIQIGGLGYMTLSTILAIIIGKVALKDRVMIKEIIDITTFSGLLHLLQKIILIVLLIEGFGAVILTGIFLQAHSFFKALYLGIFHSVSAFCNAGLSLFPNNLENYSNNYFMLFVVAALIILGGIGFLVLVEMYAKFKHSKAKVSLHSRVVLASTAVLIAAGLLLFWITEAKKILQGEDFFYCFFNSFFHSVTARTAGFDAIAENLLSHTTAIFTTFLMFIGASPGGTGGGIKTTTFVLVLFFVITVVKGSDIVNIKGRRIPEELIHKSIAIFILSLVLIALVSSVMFLYENISVLDIVFEVTSAFGTVGLSQGITASLSNLSKILIIMTMLIGRIGVLTLLMAFMQRIEESTISYPEEKVMIG